MWEQLGRAMTLPPLPAEKGPGEEPGHWQGDPIRGEDDCRGHPRAEGVHQERRRFCEEHEVSQRLSMHSGPLIYSGPLPVAPFPSRLWPGFRALQ